MGWWYLSCPSISQISCVNKDELMHRFSLRPLGLALLMMSVIGLSACDTTDQQAQQPTVSQPRATLSRQPVAANTPAAPTPRTSAPLGNDSIGSGGVVSAQARPTPTQLQSDQTALTEYESVI